MQCCNVAMSASQKSDLSPSLGMILVEVKNQVDPACRVIFARKQTDITFQNRESQEDVIFNFNSCVVWIPNKLKTIHRLNIDNDETEISIDRFCSPSQMTTMFPLPRPLFAENTEQHLYLSKEKESIFC